jgi:hypothetical protein
MQLYLIESLKGGPFTCAMQYLLLVLLPPPIHYSNITCGSASGGQVIIFIYAFMPFAYRKGW